uniref:Retrotransposon gag domain-containing protein n=1 Tax=Neogobius melanostomus TaxID=47308 RepID=A0A8C6WL95_9GOBI
MIPVCSPLPPSPPVWDNQDSVEIPGSSSTLRQFVISTYHEAQLKEMGESQNAFGAQMSQIGSILESLHTAYVHFSAQQQEATPPQEAAASRPPDPPFRESHVPDPEHYSGDMGKCGAFLLQCSLVFNQRPYTYATDYSKIAFVMGLLQGRALAWASATWETRALKKVFDHPVQGKEAAKRMLSLRQGTRSAADFSIDFRTLAAEAGWDDTALQSVFINGLSEQLKDELAVKDEFVDLDSLIYVAIKLDNRLRECRRDKALPQSSHFPTPTSQHWVTNAVGTRLTQAERLCRIQSGECMYCRKIGHFVANCPVRPKGWALQ